MPFYPSVLLKDKPVYFYISAFGLHQSQGYFHYSLKQRLYTLKFESIAPPRMKWPRHCNHFQLGSQKEISLNLIKRSWSDHADISLARKVITSSFYISRSYYLNSW